MARRRGNRGHFCSSCGFNRRNEAFSGSGHARNVCRDCAKLPHDEVVVRKAIVELERLLRWHHPLIPKRKRAEFERYLEHDNEGVRRYAQQLLEEHRRETSLLRLAEAQEAGTVLALERLHPSTGSEPHRSEAWAPDEIDEIPF